MTCSFCKQTAFYRTTGTVYVAFLCLAHMERAISQLGESHIVALPSREVADGS